MLETGLAGTGSRLVISRAELGKFLHELEEAQAELAVLPRDA